MNKYYLIEDKVIVEDNVLYENLLNYTNPKAINIALNRNFKIFGSIDKMIARARQNIKQKNVYGLNSRESNIVDEIVDKILASMEKNPLLQLFIISLAALGLYKAINVFFRIYTMSVAGLKNIFNALGTTVKDFFGVTGDYEGRQPASNIVDPKPPKPKVNPSKVSLRKTTVKSPLGTVINPEVSTPETSTQVEPKPDDNLSSSVRLDKVVAAVTTGVVSNLILKQDKAQHDIPTIDVNYNHPPKPAIYNYVDYDSSSGNLIPRGNEFNLRTPLGEVSSPDGIHIVGDNKSVDFVANIVAKRDISTSYPGGAKAYKSFRDKPQIQRIKNKEYRYKQVLDVSSSDNMVLPYDLLVFKNYRDALDARLNDKYLKKITSDGRFKDLYYDYASKYFFGNDGKYKNSGIFLKRGTVIQPITHFYQGVIGFRGVTRFKSQIFYITIPMAKTIFKDNYFSYDRAKPSTRWEESLQYHGEHRTWQYLMLK